MSYELDINYDPKVSGVTRRGFVGRILCAGAFAGCNGMLSTAGVLGDKPRLRFGVVSDVHVRLANGGLSIARCYDKRISRKRVHWLR